MKRFISILLAAMLVISMLPTAFADSTTTYEYILSATSLSGVTSSRTDGNFNLPDLTELTDYPTVVNGQKWHYIEDGSNISGNVTADNTYSGRLQMSAKGSTMPNNVWAFLKIYVPAAGLYNLDVYAADQTNAAGVDVHFLPCGDIASPSGDILSIQTKIGHFDPATSGNGNNFTERDMGGVYVETAGDYYVGFELTNNGVTESTTKQNAYISKITLTETPATALSVSPTSVSIKAGNTAQLTSTVTGADSAVLSAAKVTYTSNATGVATVDSTGKITGVAAGDATITATVAGYPTLTQNVEVKVSPATVINNYNYVFSADAIDGVTSSRTDGNFNLTDLVAVTDYPIIVDGQKWRYVEDGTKMSGNMTAARLQLTATTDNIVRNGHLCWAVVQINVPDSGIYNFDIYAADDANGADVDVYLFPCGDITAPNNSNLTEEVQKGHIDTYASGAKGNSFTERDIGNVYIEAAGDYYIGFRLVDNEISGLGEDGSRDASVKQSAYISKVTLSETPADSITVAPASVSLSTGETKALAPTVKDENGAVISGAAVEYVSGDADVATVDANGVITGGSKTGTTTVTATVKGYPNVKATVSVSNTYKDNGSLGVDLTYVFKSSVMSVEAEKAATDAWDGESGYNEGTLWYDFSFVDEADEVSTAATAPWVFNNAKVNYNHLSTRINIQLDSSKYDENQFFAIKIDVPNKGWYNFVLDTYDHTIGSAADIYVLPVGSIDKVTPADLSAEYRIGHYDAQTETKGNHYGVDIGNVEFENAGQYYVVFSFNSNNPETKDGSHYFYLDNLHLNGLGLENPKADVEVSTTETTVSFSLNCAVEDAVTVTGIDGYEIGQVNGSVPFGKSITLTAQPEMDGATFAGWYRGADVNDDSSFVSDAATYTFNAYTSFYLTAKYVAEEETDGDTVKVEFYKENGDLVGVETVAKGVSGEDIIPADVPTLIGYLFDNWYVDGSTLLGSVAEINKLTRAVALFNAKATGSAKVNYEAVASTAYNSKITKNVSGAKYWLRDGNVVGYGSNYTHYLWADTDITYSVASIENKPIIYLDDDVVDGACMVEYDKGNADAIVEVGILFGGSENINIASKNKMNASQKNYDHGQLAVAHDGNAYARGYMIYVDGGVYNVIYTDAMSVN